jgi:hypothetical protein
MLFLDLGCPTLSVSYPYRGTTGWQVRVSVDSTWEQYKLEAGKMPENCAESHLPACPWCLPKGPR